MTVPNPPADELLRALRALLLPVDPAEEVNAALAVDALLAPGLTQQEQATFILTELDRWRRTGDLPPILLPVIREALRVGFPGYGPGLAGEFGRLWRSLQDQHLLSAAEATAVLSQARVIASLAADGLMSASQIADVLMSRSPSLRLTWPAVEAVLAKLGLRRELQLAQVQNRHALDLTEQEDRFGDADLEALLDLLEREGTRLGFPGDLRQLVMQLVAPPGGAPHIPYWVILHYFCVIPEFYDHPLQYAYEFSPRGQKATWLRAQYPRHLIASDSPVLNNLKSVYELDEGWANGKKVSERPQALALVGLLNGLSALAFSARRELAALVRQALIRCVMLTTPPQVLLPPRPTLAQVQRIFQAVAQPGGTATRGIIEQRVVDAVAVLLPAVAGFVPRGLGDSVNASNLSRRKVGDCEFQDVAQRSVVGYEAHGGALAQVYVDAHLNSLEQVLPKRLAEEWAGIDPDPANWRVEVVFVAGVVPPGLTPAATVAGVPVTLTYEEFPNFTATVLAHPDLIDAFEKHVHDRLNDASTPRFVREQYLLLAGSP